MEPSDWRRVLLCGLVTGLVWTLLSVTLLAIVGTEAPLAATLPAIVVATMAGGSLYERSWKRSAGASIV